MPCIRFSAEVRGEPKKEQATAIHNPESRCGPAIKGKFFFLLSPCSLPDDEHLPGARRGPQSITQLPKRITTGDFLFFLFLHQITGAG
jgi:hypothetical protein